MSTLRLRPKPLACAAALGATVVVAGFASGATKASAKPSAQAAPAQGVSENWAGYVDTGRSFGSVSASWVQPQVSADQETAQSYSAFWVGLGGARNQSQSLEQVGTAADDVNGQVQYYAWYELVPAAQQQLKIAVSPGDRMLGRVTVSGTTVTVYLANETTGTSVTKTLQMERPDTSSAEWIAEAPAAQAAGGYERILPLANFGKVTFSDPTATADGHTGGISDSDWSTTRLDLQAPSASRTTPGPNGFFQYGSASVESTSAAGAKTSSLSHTGFSVSWSPSAAPTVIQVPYGLHTAL